MLTMRIAREPALGGVVIGIRGMIAGCGGVFGLQVDGGHDAVVFSSLVEGQFGSRAEEEEGAEGGEAVEVAGGEDFVTAGEGF